MNDELEVAITNLNQSDRVALTNKVRLGRNPSKHPGVGTCVVHDTAVSRDQMIIERTGPRQVRVSNLSTTKDLRLDLPPGPPIARLQAADDQPEARVLTLPVRITVGRTVFEVRPAARAADDSDEPALETIASKTIGVRLDDFMPPPREIDESGEIGTALEWLERLIAVLRAATGSNEFYQEAATAIVNTIGLDSGMVLLRENGGWKPVARYSRTDETGTHSEYVLDQIVAQKQTVYTRGADLGATDSLRQVSGFVASPIFDRDHDDVVGVLYGFRFGVAGSEPIREYEAQMAQVLASAVASGLARQVSDQEATRQQVQFEQFVSPQVARELKQNPKALQGEEVCITTLFADIRNFSAVSETLDATELFELIRSIMDRLAGRVREFNGTTCNFLGDGLLAMWNAPVAQGDHAELACRAALAMVGDLPAINAQWQDVIGVELGIGVGINTGIAMVGNTGCEFKPQYGPLGDTVNLASRVEGATKKLGVPILLTEATKNKIPSEFATRRVCRVRVVGRQQPVSLFQLAAETTTEEWQRRRDAFETALDEFEAGNWQAASETAFGLLKQPDGHNDHPALVLVSRAIDCLQSAPKEFDPVWDFFSK